MKIRSGTSAVAVGAAFLIGIAAGSIDRIFDSSTAKSEKAAKQRVEGAGAEYGDGAIHDPSRSYEAGGTEREPRAAQNSYQDEDVVIRGPDGLSLMADRVSDTFIGYRVIDPGTETRLRAGDVIVMVNGVAVEDSAAGGELLLAAMADPDSVIELRKTEDMP